MGTISISGAILATLIAKYSCYVEEDRKESENVIDSAV